MSKVKFKKFQFVTIAYSIDIFWNFDIIHMFEKTECHKRHFLCLALSNLGCRLEDCFCPISKRTPSDQNPEGGKSNEQEDDFGCSRSHLPFARYRVVY